MFSISFIVRIHFTFQVLINCSKLFIPYFHDSLATATAAADLAD